jgi:hypothetical protein
MYIEIACRLGDVWLNVVSEAGSCRGSSYCGSTYVRARDRTRAEYGAWARGTRSGIGTVRCVLRYEFAA